MSIWNSWQRKSGEHRAMAREGMFGELGFDECEYHVQKFEEAGKEADEEERGEGRKDGCWGWRGLRDAATTGGGGGGREERKRRSR